MIYLVFCIPVLAGYATFLFIKAHDDRMRNAQALREAYAAFDLGKTRKVKRKECISDM